MSYIKQKWVDYPLEGATNLKAEHMEHIEDGIVANEQSINQLSKEVDNKFATKEELKNIDIPDVDLSNYYTKEEIEQFLEGMGIGIADALSGYYTKTEIDSKGYKTESEIKDIVNDVITEALNSEV